MSTPSTPTGIITDAVGDLKGELLTVGAAGLVVGVAIFALKKGWRLVKGFSN